MQVDVRYANSPDQAGHMSSPSLRQSFLIQSLFEPDKLMLHYLLEDRMVVGGWMPGCDLSELPCPAELASARFAQRREIGLLNLGGAGSVHVDGVDHVMQTMDMLYIGKGSQQIVAQSKNPEKPACFYLVSLPAHQEYPTRLIPQQQAKRLELGSQEQANRRTIFQYIHEQGAPSCQLVMGWTQLHPGNVWNTMPCHTHLRRSEVYMYFDMQPTTRVFHLLGQPDQTRHLVVSEHQAVISPSWSIHSGCGTAAYSFVWAMGGENQCFNDMDAVAMECLR
jgi:4-deoxy-L-threo-5-hexosulose-uronate ketol-isomerase